MSYCVIRKEEEKKKVTRKEYEKMAVKSKKKTKQKPQKRTRWFYIICGVI
jgi:hypothetical protein